MVPPNKEVMTFKQIESQASDTYNSTNKLLRRHSSNPQKINFKAKSSLKRNEISPIKKE
jgi:hypothetical protein